MIEIIVTTLLLEKLESLPRSGDCSDIEESPRSGKRSHVLIKLIEVRAHYGND